MMMRTSCLLEWLAISFCAPLRAQPVPSQEVDICVYGGTSAGIIAAYAAKKLGKSVLLIEPHKYLGGMTTGGLGATDIGNKYAVTGLGKDFYRRIGAYYGKFEQWTFEPHVASQVYADLIREARLEVLQEFIWQEFDLFPKFPELNKFLSFWEREIEGPLHSVAVAHQCLISPAECRMVAEEYRLH